MVKEVDHIFEPNPLACGQAVLAMLSGVSVERVIDAVDTDRETTLAQMRNFLEGHGIKMADKRMLALKNGEYTLESLQNALDTLKTIK